LVNIQNRTKEFKIAYLKIIHVCFHRVNQRKPAVDAQHVCIAYSCTVADALCNEVPRTEHGLWLSSAVCRLLTAL